MRWSEEIGCINCVSAASILAKVTRDRIMDLMVAQKYPQFGLRETQVDTPVKAHIEALGKVRGLPDSRAEVMRRCGRYWNERRMFEKT